MSGGNAAAMEGLRRYVADEAKDKLKEVGFGGGAGEGGFKGVGGCGLAGWRGSSGSSAVSGFLLTSGPLSCMNQSSPSPSIPPPSPVTPDLGHLQMARDHPPRVRLQTNGCDCGVFAMMFANRVGLDRGFDFRQVSGVLILGAGKR